MSTATDTVTLVAAAAAVLAFGAVVLLARARRRRRLTAERRAAAVERLAASLERVTRELEWTPRATSPELADLAEATRREPIRAALPSDPATGLPARAALVDALVRDVAETRRRGTRLGLAHVDVEASGTGLEAAMAEVARAASRAAPEAATFRSGERSLTLVLPAAGRADAIAAVARIEASLGGTPAVRASAVELEPDEDAAALLARVAAAGR